MPARLLISGFEPFGHYVTNPSGPLVERLAADPPPGIETRGTVLPTVFGLAARVLAEHIASFAPTHVLALGVGAHPTEVRVERIAVNIASAGERGDNAGHRPVDEPVVADGPAGYFATLPVRAIVQELSRRGLSARLSQDAGTFVCNDVFYRTMHACAAMATPPLAGFVHVPYVREMPEGTGASPSLDALVEAFRGALAALLSGGSP